MSDYPDLKGTVFNIQRFTIHDGTGIRTEIFLKGCTLQCKWCSNPESRNPEPQLALNAAKCIGVSVCDQCRDACPLNGHDTLEEEHDKIVRINRHICDNCLVCSDHCPSEALFVYGQIMTVSQVLEAVLADKDYYRDQGGVTFSGGEALLQSNFLEACLKACKNEGIHTCVESALDVPTNHLKAVLEQTDLMIFDLKAMNAQNHKAWTGRSNERILENAKVVGRAGLPVIIRIPVIPGYNDDKENIMATAQFIKDHLTANLRQVQLLRFRPLGMEKYKTLGMAYPMADMAEVDRTAVEKHIRMLVEKMTNMEIPAVAGSTTPFDG